MSERVLFVDDEPNVLDAIQRTLRKQVDLRTATSGADALHLLKEEGPFALVISDMRMPSMNGAQFLAKVRDVSPDTVRMILSGQADLPATIAAVNEGHIYRFLSKPCPMDQLMAAVSDGLKQYRLITAEKVLLEQTLGGSVKMLVDILAMVSPTASGRATRLQRYSVELRKALGLKDRWEWDLAVLVSQIGWVALPKDILLKVESLQALNDEEKRLYESHPEVTSNLLGAIPRLEDVAAIVAAQFTPVSFSGKPTDIRHWDVRSTGQMLLRTSIDFDRLITGGATHDQAVDALVASKLALPQPLITALRTLTVEGPALIARQVRLKDMVPGMVLVEDLLSLKGIRLVPAGQEITSTLLTRLNSINGGVGVVQPIRVRVTTQSK
jgi:response regulator RpfG family c-di-GMP phosphodiesterase